MKRKESKKEHNERYEKKEVSVTFFAANFARADKTAGAFTARIFNINALGRSLPSRIGSKIAYSWAM